MKLNYLKTRCWITAILVVVIFGIYLARLISVQIINAEEIRQRLDTGYVSKQHIPAVRGEIVDRNGVPIVVNKQGYDVIIDMIALPKKSENQTIAKLMQIFQENNTTWTDTLPITTSPPFAFLNNHDAAITKLKELLDIQPYATVEDTLYQLSERYDLQAYSPAQARRIAGVRYEMERRGFNINVLYTFASDINIDLVLKIKENSYYLPGVDIHESALRSYAQGDLAPHLIGRTGPIYEDEWPERKKEGYSMDDILGKAGIERYMEKQLQGKPGERAIVLDNRQQVVGVEDAVQAVPGNTVYLTIDANLQDLLQKALDAQIQHLRATAAPGRGKEADTGAAVVVHCKTGEVLAIANFPYYNNNTFSHDYEELASDPNEPLFNRAMQGLYAPGSVFKPVVGTIGLSSGVIEADSRILCSRVYQRFTTHRFTCLSAHGNITLAQALQHSCNIFFYETGFNVGIDAIDRTAKQYGLGEKTGINLIEEAKGQRSNPETFEKSTGEKWTNGNIVQSAIGQLAAKFTPLQMANYTATIANRGQRMELTLVKEVRDYTRETVITSHTPKVADVVDGDREVFETVIDGMVRASRPGGTASASFGSYPIDVASKTGTPESKMLNSTFIAFAPAENPEIAIAVVIENGYHGYTSAPVARAIFDEYFGFPNAYPLVPKEALAAYADDASEADEKTESDEADDMPRA